MLENPCIGECAEEWRNPGCIAIEARSICVYTSAIAIAYFSRRRDQVIAAALHAFEIARVDAERARLHAALVTMQAGVEPGFLLASLRDVGTLCASDREAGGRMLDLLIEYLRSALPQMRETSSTLARESALLSSYLGILELRSGKALRVSCDFEQAIGDARLPAMILLPMAAAMARAEGSSGAVDVAARGIDGRVRITLTAQGEIARNVAEGSALADVRARLAAFHGDRASFVVERSAERSTRVILDIPHERGASVGGREDGRTTAARETKSRRHQSARRRAIDMTPTRRWRTLVIRRRKAEP